MTTREPIHIRQRRTKRATDRAAPAFTEHQVGGGHMYSIQCIYICSPPEQCSVRPLGSLSPPPSLARSEVRWDAYSREVAGGDTVLGLPQPPQSPPTVPQSSPVVSQSHSPTVPTYGIVYPCCRMGAYYYMGGAAYQPPPRLPCHTQGRYHVWRHAAGPTSEVTIVYPTPFTRSTYPIHPCYSRY